jgi:hypothetical protein
VSRWWGVIAFVIGLLGLIVAAGLDWIEAARAYFWAFLSVSALPLGSLAWLMIYHLTGGRWGRAIAPLARPAALTIPLLVLFFLPLGLVLPELYAWARPEVIANDHLWSHRSSYLNPAMFWLRSVGAILVWSYLAWKMQAWTSTPLVQKTASWGLVAHLAFTGLLSVDWSLSLEHHFFSTIFGLLVMVLQTLTAFSFLTALSTVGKLDQGVSYDLGGLLLAQVMLTGYLNFSQVVIIWSGNLPHPASWLEPRVWGAWAPLAIGLLLVHLFLPFLLLMWGGIKRRTRVLGRIAALTACLGPVQFFWLVVPSFHPDRVPFHGAYPAALLTLAGAWWFVFTLRWKRVS